MTIYCYNPPAPSPIWTQPSPDGDDALSNFMGTKTKGRCGHCVACPRVYKLTVPAGDGIPTWLTGDYYLRKQPWATTRGGGVTDALPYQCRWQAVNGVDPINQRNNNPEQLNAADSWILGYDGFSEIHFGDNVGGEGWFLLTPRIVSDLFTAEQSLYRCYQSHFRCRETNLFHVAESNYGEFAFPWLPEPLTITVPIA